MPEITIEVIAHDPIVARDGRPFGAGQGNQMHCLDWPLPSVVAGSFRTALVKATDKLDFTGNIPQQLLDVSISGIFPFGNGTLYLPAPADAVGMPPKHEDAAPSLLRTTPQEVKDGGCDFPGGAPLKPVMLSFDDVADDFKPATIPHWWPADRLYDWLAGRPVNLNGRFLQRPIEERRDHVHINARTGAAEEGQIYSTAAINLRRLPAFTHGSAESPSYVELSLVCRACIDDGDFAHAGSLSIWHPFGGERRLAYWRSMSDEKADQIWQCPDELRSQIANADKIRMQLVTPGIFDGGWLPGWLDRNSLEGRPFDGAPRLKLVGVSNQRWTAVSGWSLAKPRGPKPVQRMVPAGAIYFFERVEGDASSLGTHGWLRSVSDQMQNCRDGFGLAVWGTW
ncbi:MAG: CRISPR-associated protein Cmr3 [Gemmatales bacterium]|nr:MAG: CRISPR-associated protein Cmr3 [Gemmatales bacterium]